MKRTLFVIICSIILAACQASPAPKPGAPFPEKFSQSVEANGNQVTLTCQGSGEPTIILENHFEFSSWDDASLARFAKISRTCIDYRPGMIPPDSVTGTLTALDQANDLHIALQKLGVPGPYIMVGYVSAGYNILLYASQYPKEVAGLVCVHCYNPVYFQSWYEKVKELSASGSTAVKEDNEALSACMKDKKWEVGNQENVDFCASYHASAKVTSLGDIPLTVLTAQTNQGFAATDELDKISQEVWVKAAEKFSQYSTHGKAQIVSGANWHDLPDNPAVDQAIQEIVNAARK
jgi:pimeloyl-ACP methyl ester carboxylesterase